MLTLNRNLSYKYCRAILLAFLSLLLVQCNAKRIWPNPIVTHDTSNTHPLWVRSSIYTVPDSQSSLVADSGKLFLLGSDNATHRSQVIAFDGDTGDILWRYNFSYVNDGFTIIATSSKVLVGGIGDVVALDAENGQVIWSTEIPFGRSVIALYISGNNLYVDSVGSRYSILDIAKGSILQSEAYDLGENPPFWKITIGNGWWKNAVLVDDFFYGRTGNQYGNLHAFELSSRRQLWVSADSIVSNIVATSTDVYALSLDGNLLLFDPMSGIQTVLGNFSSTPFNLQSNAAGGYLYYYYLAADPESKIIFITLGDSAQLFAVNRN
jgi:outer membrane protein assembly factor BamB